LPRGITALALVAITATSCGEWPRYNYVSEEKGLSPGSVDPVSLVDIAWAEGTESPDAENDIPTGDDVRDDALAQSTGLLISGVLDGTGWSRSAEAESIESASCAGTVGKRTTTQSEGDYIGDVDFLMIVTPEVDGTLCGLVEQPQDLLGWDLALLEVDACGIPIATITDGDGGDLGVDLGGQSGGWGVPVTAGLRYAVLFAGYDPNDPANQVEYTLGVSLVGSKPNGSVGVCPAIPEGPS